MLMSKFSRQVTDRFHQVLQEYGRELKLRKGMCRHRIDFTLPLHDCCINFLKYEIRIIDDVYYVDVCPPFQADLHDKSKTREMATFLLKANSVLGYAGCFQLDFSNGNIRFSIVHKCDGHIPSDENIREAIRAAADAYEIYYWGIAGILVDSFATAEEAFEVCENEKLRKLKEFLDNNDTVTQKDAGTVTEADSENINTHLFDE